MKVADLGISTLRRNGKAHSNSRKTEDSKAGERRTDAGVAQSESENGEQPIRYEEAAVLEKLEEMRVERSFGTREADIRMLKSEESWVSFAEVPAVVEEELVGWERNFLEKMEPAVRKDSTVLWALQENFG